MALVEIKDLVISYGAITAVKGVSLNIEKGSIVAILGANGAGKTSLIRSVSGAVKVKTGTISFDGNEIQNLQPFEITSKRVMQSPEGRSIFYGLTVEENLLTGAYSLKNKTLTNEGGSQTIIKTSQRKKELLEMVFGYFPVLRERRKQQASTLSGGEQQMLAIGRALMGDPELLLLDEPSLGLAPIIVKNIFEIIDQIRSTGRTILIVEQNAFQTLKLADYAYVLELGKIAKEGTGQELLNDKDLIEAYLGK